MTNPSKADLAALSAVLIFLFIIIESLPADDRVKGLSALALVLAGVARVLSAAKR